MRSARAAVAGLAATLLCALLWLAPATADFHDEGELQVQITDMTPSVLRPDGEVTISGTISNTSPDPITDPLVELRMQRNAVSSRLAIEGWMSEETPSTLGVALPFAERIEEEIDAGASVPFEIVLPSAPTFAETSEWGARGIEIVVTADQQVGSVRSFLLWFPTESPLPAPAEFTTLLPLTPTADEWRTSLADETPVAHAAAPRLEQVLADVDHLAVAWAIDPALYDDAVRTPHDLDALSATVSAEAGPDDDATPPTEDDDAGESDGEGAGGGDGDETAEPADGTNGEATGTDEPDDAEDPGANGSTLDGDGPDDAAVSSLQSALTDGTRGRDVLQLDYAAADIGALQRAGDLTLWRQGNARGEQLFGEHGIRALDRVHWPMNTPDEDAVRAIADTTPEGIVISEDTLEANYLSWAMGPTATLQSPGGAADAIVIDDTLSGLLTGRGDVNASSELTGGADEIETVDAATARQWLLADTAAAVRERGGLDVAFVAAYPQGVTADDIAFDVGELAEVPWLQLSNVRSVLGRASGEDAGIDPVWDSPAPSGLTAGQLRVLTSAQDDVHRLAATLTDPEPLHDIVEPAILTAISGTLDYDPDVRQGLIDAVRSTGNSVNQAIRVETGSAVLLINHRGEIPVTVANDLPVPAQVTVALQPQDPRLRAPEQVLAELEPNAVTTVRVPVQAVANGNVDVNVQLLTEAGGEDLGETASLAVRVRAEWEDIGTAIVAGLLAVGFVFGLTRTIRSGRRTSAAHARPGKGATT